MAVLPLILLAAMALAEPSSLEQAGMKCQKYMCNSDYSLSPDTCMYYKSDAYYIQSCQDRTDGLTYCDPKITFMNSTCQAPPQVVLHSFPGGPCHDENQCGLGHCDTTTSRCVGAQKGEYCSHSISCDPGLYCDNFSCTELLSENSVCSEYNSCDYGMQCNTTIHGSGHCIPLYSVPNGEYVAHCQEPFGDFCQSGTCIRVNSPNIGICIDPVKSSNRNPHRCGNSEQCIGSSSGFDFMSQCKCGYNEDGYAYCFPFTGDYQGEVFLDFQREYAKVNKGTMCNIVMSRSNDCILVSGFAAAEEFVLAKIRFYNYPYLQENDKCVREVVTGYYWGAALKAVLPSSLLILGLAISS